MKKTYSKPEIVFEDFSMSTSITAGCELDTNLQTYEQSCGYKMERSDAVVFIEGASCTYKPQDGLYNGFCYHVPYEYGNLFNS